MHQLEASRVDRKRLLIGLTMRHDYNRAAVLVRDQLLEESIESFLMTEVIKDLLKANAISKIVDKEYWWEKARQQVRNRIVAKVIREMLTKEIAIPLVELQRCKV